MAKRTRRRLSAGLGRLGDRIESWRRTRAKKGEMPADLWSEAVVLARAEGAYAVHLATRVNYDGLKRRMAESGAGATSAAAPAFVELSGAQLLEAPTRADTVVEVSDARGARMTVRMAAETQVDVARLVAAFRQRDDG